MGHSTTADVLKEAKKELREVVSDLDDLDRDGVEHVTNTFRAIERGARDYLNKYLEARDTKPVSEIAFKMKCDMIDDKRFDFYNIFKGMRTSPDDADSFEMYFGQLDSDSLTVIWTVAENYGAKISVTRGAFGLLCFKFTFKDEIE